MPPPPNTPDGSTPPELSPLHMITVPPNTPFNHGSPRSRRTTRTRNSQSIDETNSCEAALSDRVDFRNLKYTSDVDENLLCPICHAALVEPVTTVCDHTFCKECLYTAWGSNPTCPVDRSPLSLPSDTSPSPKIILNQLDALKVKCLCCNESLPRSVLRNHLRRYCSDALINCPDQACEKLVKRKYEGRGCLHHDAICPDCRATLQEVDMELHREIECERREASCDHCGEPILRCKEVDHLKNCAEVLTACRWSKYGCQHEASRRQLDDHVLDCKFTVVGQMADMLQAEVAVLRDQVQALGEKDKAQERRIKFLETHPHFNFSDVSSQSVSRLPDSSTTEFPESRDQYLLSLLESQESKVDQLSAGMTELEGKQTMMLFNETIPIKEQLAELRSAQGVIGMHVRWLMNFRMQERRPGPGTGGSADSAGPGNDGQPHRRLSDTMRDVITKL